ncbi:MAG: 6-carboxytetrahydropterin synthase [Bdellovibrionales bacterium]|nr:6-carboxytetrahydropterin synthase [Bdellovibrionales bacterium]
MIPVWPKSFWKLTIEKDRFKFSSAHMTLFADGSKEALHGHNYTVRLDVVLSGSSLAQTISFSVFKDLLGPLCEAWDERILIATANTQTQCQKEGNSLEAVVCGKRYVFPSDEVVCLNVENITSELLASELAGRLVEALKNSGYWGKELVSGVANPIQGIELHVIETAGQGASFTVMRV